VAAGLEFWAELRELEQLTGDMSTPLLTDQSVYLGSDRMPTANHLRLYMQGDGSNYADQNIHLNLIVPTQPPADFHPTLTPASLQRRYNRYTHGNSRSNGYTNT